MANELTFNQVSTVLNSIVNQATGKSLPVATDTGSFVTQAQTALKAGYDPVLNAISQTLSRTIFSIRPYYRKFGGLEVDSVKWGNHVRKLTNVDSTFSNDDRYLVEDGQSIDPWIVKKNKVLQTNFYGQEVFQFQSPTYFRDQLDVAFRGPEEFAQYIDMVTQNARDIIEQGYEGLARMVLANLIGGKLVADTPSVIHLVTEYNDYAGTELDSETVRQPENFLPFAKWAFGRIQTLRDMMTERTGLYQMQITGKEVNRHTPLDRQKVYILANEINHIDASVLSSVYNEQFLRYGDHERVNFWQAPGAPSTINVKPNYINSNGVEVKSVNAVEEDNVFGVIFDEEACGYTRANEWSGATSFNPRAGMYNLFFHSTGRYWTDLTEKAVVLLLD